MLLSKSVNNDTVSTFYTRAREFTDNAEPSTISPLADWQNQEPHRGLSYFPLDHAGIPRAVQHMRCTRGSPDREGQREEASTPIQAHHYS
jgi:hypothetical protein